MALINCPECSKEVSDMAEHCIHCGYPFKKKDGLTFEEQLEFEKAFIAMDNLFKEDDTFDSDFTEEEYLCCNKCYSSKLTPMKSGFSVGKAALGALTLGVYGIVAGSIGSNNIRLYCNKCGNKLKSKDALSLTKSMQKYYKKNMK